MTHTCVGNLTSIDWTAPSHYLNQYCIIVNWALRNKLQWNVIQNSNIFIQKMHFKISSAKWCPFCFGLNALSASCAMPAFSSMSYMHSLTQHNTKLHCNCISSCAPCIFYEPSHRRLSRPHMLAFASHASAHLVCVMLAFAYVTGLILGLRPASERRLYFVTTPLTGWTQT